ncbi:STAS domain-containing protein [Streptomyces sp. SAS_272]|uniref:STAS domain-containing protein n=1 Tax=Streptomyces sp. SAS_272 TaxID=3412747 RepID=UPI00403CC775
MSHIENADLPARFHAEDRMVEGVRVVALRGEIDHDVKERLGAALRGERGVAPERIVADLSEVTFMDSSGINVFVRTHRRVSGSGGWVRIAGAQEPVLHVLQLVGIDTLIACLPTVEQALAD